MAIETDTDTGTDVNYSDEGLSPFEMQQFEAMRAGSDVPTDPPAELDHGTVQPETSPAPADGTQPPAQPVEQRTQPAPEDDPDPDIEVTDPRTGKKGKRVSLGKFLREQGKVTDLEKRLQELQTERETERERNARLDERLRILNEALATPPAEQQQQQQQEEVPDPEKDIFGYARYIGKQLENANKRIEAFENAGREREAYETLAQTYREDAARFAAAEPGFAEAYVFLVKQRDAELLQHGMTDPKQRQAQITREEQGLVRNSLDANKSPAEAIFNLAKVRGFAPKPAAPAPVPGALDAPAAGRPAPAAAPAAAQRQAAPAPAAPAAPSVTAEIEAIRRGQEAALSLSVGAGGAPPQELTSAMLADMPQDEFDALMARLPKSKIRELFGD